MHLPLRMTAAFALTIATSMAIAAPQSATKKPLTAQQQRMSDCSKQSAGQTGAARKSFMSSCLKGQTAAAPAKQTQQEKMKSCNVDAKAKALTGADRKSFMSNCLKGDGAKP